MGAIWVGACWLVDYRHVRRAAIRRWGQMIAVQKRRWQEEAARAERTRG